MEIDRSMLESASVKRLKSQLGAIVDDYLLHDGWGHMELDMKILARQQKEVVVKAGREYRYIIDFKNAAPLGKGSENK